MNRKEVAAAYQKHYNPVLGRFWGAADVPLEMRGEGTRVYDETGRSYLDFAAGFGVFHVGHCHPRIRAAVLNQLQTLATAPPGLLQEPMATFISRLSKLLPRPLDRVFLVNSGSEAIEIARRTAHVVHPDRRHLVAAIKGYHGKTIGTLAITGQDHLRLGFEPMGSDAVMVPYGDLGAMEKALEARTTAAVFLEPILGGGYITVPPPGYLAGVRELCDRTDTLLVADEVQTGFGRTGRMFGIDHDGVVPDLIVLSKGITGGHTSMAAVVMREEVVARAQRRLPTDPLAFTSDSSGLPIACAAANAALDVIIEEKLAERAARLGPRLLAGLNRVREAYPDLVFEAPGAGLMTGARLRSPVIETAAWYQMLRQGVMMGYSTNTIARRPAMRFFPPLTVTEEEIDQAVDAFGETCKLLRRKPMWVYDAANQLSAIQFKLPRWAMAAFMKTVIQ